MADASSTASQLLRNAWRATPASSAARLSRGRWKRARHLEYISDTIADAAHKGGQRIIISAPPRHGKSELVSKHVPPWYLDQYPDRRVISCAYGANLARKWGRDVRNIAQENARDLHFHLASDSKRAAAWDTVQGGGMTTAGVNGAITGLGAHLFFIDDPYKNWRDAYSPKWRENVWSWWQSTAATRLEPDASVVIVATRWHHDDLSGRLIRESLADPDADQWTVINLPAIAEAGDVLGRSIGEALWPARYDEKRLAKIEKLVGPLVWAALYQGRPKQANGGHFPAELWKYYSQLPDRFDRIISSWDCAFKETKDSDFVVGGVWGSVGVNDYLLDLWRARADIIKTMDAMKAQATKWRPRGMDGIYVEDKANGPAIITLLRNEVGGLVPVEPDGGKLARAIAASPRQQGGNVYLPAKGAIAQMMPGFVAEHEEFPNGANDDQVDMFSQAMRVLRGNLNMGSYAGPSDALDSPSWLDELGR